MGGVLSDVCTACVCLSVCVRVAESAVMLMPLTKPLNNYSIPVTLCNVRLPLKHMNAFVMWVYLKKQNTPYKCHLMT